MEINGEDQVERWVRFVQFVRGKGNLSINYFNFQRKLKV